MLGPDRVAAMAAIIESHVRRTPVVSVRAFGAAAPLVLKLESLQLAGSFKARGATAKLLTTTIPGAGVATASGGNHGIAVATVAAGLGLRAEIFIHTKTAPAKRARLEATGAVVNVGGESYAEAEAACRRHVAATGALWVPAYDDETVVAGAGTLARELEAQAELDTLLVAVGGGGLIGGCAAWYEGRVKIVGVETFGTPTLHHALAAGHPVDVEISGLGADALGARRAGEVPFAVARRHVDRVVLVEDQALRDAQRALWSELRVAAEPAGAASLAALLAGAYVPAAGERVGVLICGANVDPATL
jgi:threonine dehydratase